MFPKQQNQWLASSLFFFSIVAISTSAIFAKFTTASPSILSMYRLWFACLLLLPMAWKKREQMVTIGRKGWLSLAGAGFFLAMHFFLWYSSLLYTSIASSTIILALQPVISLVGGFFFFRDKVNRLTIGSMCIAIIGAMMIGWGDLGLSKKAIIGDFLSFVSVIMVVFYLLIGQNMVKKVSHWIYTFFVFAFAAITLTIINIGTQQPFFDYRIQDWIIFFCLALIPSCAMVIHNWLMNYVTATTISMGILGEPLGASALAYVILGEQLSVFQWGGGILVIIGVFFFLMIQNREEVVVIKEKDVVTE
ncbi:MAG: DMT family transporter [Bacillaceae bacterium]